MQSSPKWYIPLSRALYLIAFICLICDNSKQLVAEEVESLGPKVTNSDSGNPEFIGIDCGASEDYMDEETGLWFQTDKDFIEIGINHEVVSFIDNDNSRPLKTVGILPEGDRTCYTLKPKQGKNNTYNIGAPFLYEDYDYRNQVPSFDLYVGGNYWVTVGNSNDLKFYDMIYHSSADIIQVCLVNTGIGTTFISSLELQSLNISNSIYSNYSSSLPSV